jgi:two-component system response regulator AlgR
MVCDDEKLARDRLVRLVSDIEGIDVVAEAGNGREALEQAQASRPDVVLMDIRMPDMDGIEAAQHLLKSDTPPAVIFCTAYDEHALQAFKVHAVDYLLKPVSRDDLANALQRVNGLSRTKLAALEPEMHQDGSPRRRHISARTHKGIELISVDDIRYFMADQKYVTVRHGDGEVLIDETLKELEDEFPGQFVRIHRNALISLGFLEGMEMSTAGHYQVRLRGVEDRLTVSRRHVAGLRKVMARL